jgi:hypothetical protein
MFLPTSGFWCDSGTFPFANLSTFSYQLSVLHVPSDIGHVHLFPNSLRAPPFIAVVQYLLVHPFLPLATSVDTFSTLFHMTTGSRTNLLRPFHPISLCPHSPGQDDTVIGIFNIDVPVSSVIPNTMMQFWASSRVPNVSRAVLGVPFAFSFHGLRPSDGSLHFFYPRTLDSQPQNCNFNSLRCAHAANHVRCQCFPPFRE